jgi:hypothetical protein
MKSIRLAVLTALVALPTVVFAQEGGAVTWLEGSGRSCDKVCRDDGRVPVSSGIFMPNGNATDNTFHVCAADTNGEGYRPGFNLKPKWNKICVVAWGREAVNAEDYLCACE